MIIAFVGEYEQSLENLLALSFMLSHQYKKKVLLPECRFMSVDLESVFCKGRYSYVKEEAFLGVKEGMDYLLYRQRQDLLNEAILKEGITYLTDSFGYVKAAVQGDYQMYGNSFTVAFEQLNELFQKQFDVVLYVCGWGERIEEQWVVQECDSIIYNGRMEEFPNLKDLLKWKEMNKPCFFLFGNVFGDVQKAYRLLINYYRLESQQIGMLPYCAEFRKCISNGQAWDYYRKRIHAHRFETYFQQDYYKQLQNVSRQFVKWFEKQDNGG